VVEGGTAMLDSLTKGAKDLSPLAKAGIATGGLAAIGLGIAAKDVVTGGKGAGVSGAALGLYGAATALTGAAGALTTAAGVMGGKGLISSLIGMFGAASPLGRALMLADQVLTVGEENKAEVEKKLQENAPPGTGEPGKPKNAWDNMWDKWNQYWHPPTGEKPEPSPFGGNFLDTAMQAAAQKKAEDAIKQQFNAIAAEAQAAKPPPGYHPGVHWLDKVEPPEPVPIPVPRPGVRMIETAPAPITAPGPVTATGPIQLPSGVRMIESAEGYDKYGNRLQPGFTPDFLDRQGGGAFPAGPDQGGPGFGNVPTAVEC
jgi:hypothetical protein